MFCSELQCAAVRCRVLQSLQCLKRVQKRFAFRISRCFVRIHFLSPTTSVSRVLSFSPPSPLSRSRSASFSLSALTHPHSHMLSLAFSSPSLILPQCPCTFVRAHESAQQTFTHTNTPETQREWEKCWRRRPLFAHTNGVAPLACIPSRAHAHHFYSCTQSACGTQAPQNERPFHEPSTCMDQSPRSRPVSVCKRVWCVCACRPS